MNSPTPKHLRTLRHMLGINDPNKKTPEPYRDYYCANHGDPHIAELLDRDLVVMYRRDDRYEWFRTTDIGRAAALASHKTIRNSKSRRLYSRFLDCRDAWPDLTFKQFLTDPRLAQIRRDA